jgi:transposase-like protein
MKKEDVFNDALIKQFQTGEELSCFLKEIQNRGIEKVLEGELDSQLGDEKHSKSKEVSARNGFTTKKVRTSYGVNRLWSFSTRFILSF